MIGQPKKNVGDRRALCFSSFCKNHTTTEILMKFVDPEEQDEEEEEEEGGVKLSFTSESASEWRGGGARSLSDK